MIKNQLRRLFDAAFSSDKAWNNWFFENVFREEDAVYLEVDDTVVSMMLLQQYNFRYQRQDLPMAYICGVTTDHRYRHQGYMEQLMHRALSVAYDRGDAFASLIPATRLLYFFYDKFDFATVVYSDIERYTALHSFPINPEYSVDEPTFEAFAELENRLNDPHVIHTREDYENICADIRHDGGRIALIRDNEGQPAAMAFAVPHPTEIHVKEVLGTHPQAVDMALGAVRDAFAAALPLAVHSRAYTSVTAISDEEDRTDPCLRAYGMIRLINVHKVLTALAQNHPQLNYTIRVKDRHLPQNNGIYRLSGGKCTVSEDSEVVAKQRLDLDVTVEVLTKVLFSGNRIGHIIGLPAAHPSLTLMLD